ncbi:MAG: hypothetical protein J6K23_04940 [Bacilli bacterium]|nr:hypothetical protein [Bacilli bacterium]
MENNKQNSVLLIIIAVATLLVAVVGATFAYFTANNPEGSTAEVKTKSGKMEIEFADGTDAIAAAKQTGFEPSNTVLVDKTFTITGDNITTSAPNNNGTLGTESSLVMPFIVSLDYTTTFINNELHVLVKKMNADSAYTQKISYTGATLLKNSTTAPATLKSISDFQEYYDYTVGKGTTDAKESSETKELVYGEFKDTKSASLADRQVTLRLVMIFPDTGEKQDYNKSATFNGILSVTTTQDGSARK